MKATPVPTLDLHSAVPACQESDLSPALRDRLLKAMDIAGFNFTITSGYRSQAYERSKGRSGSSSHCRGLAVDISTCDSHTRYKVVGAAILVGFPRVGIGKNFVHLDIDETKAHPIIFHYYE